MPARSHWMPASPELGRGSFTALVTTDDEVVEQLDDDDDDDDDDDAAAAAGGFVARVLVCVPILPPRDDALDVLP